MEYFFFFFFSSKYQVINERFTIAKPQIAEDFAWYLMEVGDHQDQDKTLTLTYEQLNIALSTLATTIMTRERSNYENYSMFYENLLRQHHQLLYQREQVRTCTIFLFCFYASRLVHKA